MNLFTSSSDMQKLLKWLSYFLLGFIILSVIINNILPENKYWGNEEYQSKIETFKKQKYNTVFFGSSRILTGINPEYFDSLANGALINVKSYNLATTGTWANETFYLYEQFLDDAALSSGIGIVFMEFQNIMAIRTDRISTPKVTYYQSLKNVAFIADFAKEEIRSSIKKLPVSLYMAGLYSLATLEEHLNMGKSKIFFDDVKDSVNNSFDSRGHMVLDRIAKNEIGATLDMYIKNINANLSKTALRPNPVFHDKLMELIRQSEARGIKLVFILPPVKLTPSMMAVFHSLPQENKIQICDPTKFEALYEPENWADYTHFNARGTRVLNEYLARELSNSSVYHFRSVSERKNVPR